MMWTGLNLRFWENLQSSRSIGVCKSEFNWTSYIEMFWQPSTPLTPHCALEYSKSRCNKSVYIKHGRCLYRQGIYWEWSYWAASWLTHSWSKSQQVVVELVPTFYFAMYFLRACISATPPVVYRRLAAVSDTQYTRCSCLVVCAIYVWGFTAGQGVELYFSGGICRIDNLHFSLY